MSQQPVTLESLAELILGVHQKNEARLDLMDKRLEGLESRRAAPGAITLQQSQTQQDPYAPSIRHQRCETCNAIFEGLWVYGGEQKCAECKRPNAKIAVCKCQKRYSFVEGEPEDRCPTCRQCVLCGTKESDKVCGACARKPGVYVCDCGRLAKPGNAMNMCGRCHQEFMGKGPHRFAQNLAPDAPPDAEHLYAHEPDTSVAGQQAQLTNIYMGQPN